MMLMLSIILSEITPILLICLIVLLSIFLAYLLAGFIIIYKIFRTKRQTEEELIVCDEVEKNFNREWLTIPFESLYLKSDFGYNIFARLYKTTEPSKKYIVALHGHGSAGITMLIYMKEFTALGYNVIIPDNRNCGRSGGNFTSFGYFERYDLLKWIEWVKKEDPEAVVGLFGVSLGAATVLMTSALTNNLKFVIVYCGYASMRHLVAPYLRNSQILYSLLEPALRMAAGGLYGVKLRAIRADLALKKSSAPTLLLHSKEDAVVSYSNALVLKEARPDAELVSFEKGQHARSICVNHDAFIEAVTKFLKNYS
ncbi:MAG: alpha/beta hydrolase [Christensenellaceae bacterium]|nr:alpha/beta hydrolase [Christensenellaceae bacterium]